MATTKIVIRRTRVNRRGQTPICVKYTHREKSIVFATGQQVEPKNFHPKGHVRKSQFGSSKINDLIKAKQREIDDIRLDLQIAKVDPSTAAVKQSFLARQNKTPAPNFSGALQYWPQYMAFLKNSKKVVDSTLRQYRSALQNLQSFQQQLKRELTFSSFDDNFYNSYLDWLYNRVGCNHNSAGNKIKLLKAFLNWAVKKNLTHEIKFRDYIKPSNATTIVTITKEQLDKLLNLDLSYNPSLSMARDIFVLGASTGLRYSDYSRLKAVNFKKDHITITTLKTGLQLYIPLNQYSREIIRRHPAGLPFIHNGCLNKLLKEVARIAAFDEDVEVTTYPKGNRTTTYRKLHELVMTHTARRVFITQSLSRGMLAADIMRITGNRDMRIFQRYINVSEKRLQDEVSRAWG